MRPAPIRPITTPPARLAWLEAEVARAEPFQSLLRGAELPQTPGATIVCSLAIDMDPWYGAADRRWELTHAHAMLPARATAGIREELRRIGIRNFLRRELTHAHAMLPARATAGIREELRRIGIRNCVLDVDR